MERHAVDRPRGRRYPCKVHEGVPRSTEVVVLGHPGTLLPHGGDCGNEVAYGCTGVFAHCCRRSARYLCHTRRSDFRGYGTYRESNLGGIMGNG